jgi:hypothetical protein
MAKQPVKVSGKKNKVLTGLYVSVLVIAIAFGAFFATQYFRLNDKYKAAIMTQDEKNNQYLASIGKIIDLPKNEKPAYISLVKDKSKLGGAAVTKKFFESAQDNDIVVAYKDGNLSIIYRPNTNKIIKTDNYNNFVAAISPVSVAVIAAAGQQDAVAKQVTDKVLNADIVSKNTPKVTATQSYVADLTGSNATAAKELADKLGLTVATLQDGEAKPQGATLVVVVAPTAQ